MRIICIISQRGLENSSSVHSKNDEILCVLSEFLFSVWKLFFLEMRIAMWWMEKV